MVKCLVAQFGLAVCHIEVNRAAGGSLVARPWAQDGSRMRPVLTNDGQYPEFIADAEGAAVIGAVEFLQGRFGPMTDRPVACATPGDHRKHLDLPLRWTDEPPDSIVPDGRR